MVDHQVAILEFANNATASFTMSAFTECGDREITIMGEKGSIKCKGLDIEHYDFLTDTKTKIVIDTDNLPDSGHGGGDFGLVRDFLNAVRENDYSYITSGPDVSL